MKENCPAISLDYKRKVQDATSSIMHGATHASHLGKVFQLCSGLGSGGQQAGSRGNTVQNKVNALRISPQSMVSYSNQI